MKERYITEYKYLNNMHKEGPWGKGGEENG